MASNQQECESKLNQMTIADDDWEDKPFPCDAPQTGEVSSQWNAGTEDLMEPWDDWHPDPPPQNDGWTVTRNKKKQGNRGRGNNRKNFRGTKNHNDRWTNNRHNNYNNNTSRNDWSDGNNTADDNSQPLISWEEVARRNKEYIEAELASLPSIVRKLYFEDPAITALTTQQVDAIRFQNFKTTVSNINIEGKEPNKGVIPKPVLTFEQAFKKYPEIYDVVTKRGFKEPTPIQKQAWPVLMSGRDLVGIAQTGTGKTLAFLLPGIIHIMAQTTPLLERPGPSMLILAPTRELAQQIHSEILKFQVEGIRSVCIYGQGDTQEQKRMLENGVEIIVATPGRLMDFEKKGVTTLKHISFFILDEADRMLDLGFQPDIMKLHYSIREDRQVAMTSATWLCDIQYVANKLMNDPVMVRVGSMDLAAVHTVSQKIKVCEQDDKIHLFEEYAKGLEKDDKVIVFANRKAVVTWLGMKLIEYNIFDYDVMSGDIPQESREKALELFRTGEVRILIATDVASRGLDVKGVTKVLNYDVPKNMEEYVHRCGRTGRAEKTGQVLSFVCWDDRSKVSELIEVLNRGKNEIPVELTRMAERFQRQREQRRGGGARGGRRGYARGGYSRY